MLSTKIGGGTARYLAKQLALLFAVVGLGTAGAGVARAQVPAPCNPFEVTATLDSTGTVITIDHATIQCNSVPALLLVNAIDNAPLLDVFGVTYLSGPADICIGDCRFPASVGATFPVEVGGSSVFNDPYTFLVPGTYVFQARGFFAATAAPRNFTVTVTQSALRLKVALSLDNFVEPSPNTSNPNKVGVTVTVTDSGGNPRPNVTVSLKAEPFDLATAGHDHATSGPNLLNNLTSASPGAFMPTGQAVQSCTTDANGICKASYGVSVISGTYTISAALSNDPSTLVSKFLFVRVGATRPPLFPLPEGPGYQLVGSWNGGSNGVTSQHTLNHFGTAGLDIAIAATALEYFTETGGVLGINDMSLPLGGLFDIFNNWKPDHHLHRLGTSVDINTHQVNGGAVDTAVLVHVAREWMRRIPEGPKIHFEVL